MSEPFPYMFVDENKDIDPSVLQAIAIKNMMKRMSETDTIVSVGPFMNEQIYKDIYNWGRAAQLQRDIEQGSKDEDLEEGLTHEYLGVRKASLDRLKLIKKKEKKNVRKKHTKKLDDS